MTVSLNIENDVELRAYLKDCIKGQVLSVTRDEIKKIIETEITRKMKATYSSNIDNILIKVIKEIVEDILRKEFNVGNWGSEFIQPFIDNKLESTLKDKNWKQEVEKVAVEKLRKLIQ